MMNKFKKLSSYARNNLLCYGFIALAFVILFPLQQLGLISNSLKGQLIPICTYIVMAISLNLTVGILGELSLGHAGFMSIGAFSGVVIAARLENVVASDVMRLILGILLGGICAGIAGFIIGIPVLRLRGDYLAIVTLAFGEIIKNIVNCLYIGYDNNGMHISLIKSIQLGNGGRIILNGPQGATGVPRLATFPAGIILIFITLFIVLNLIHSKTGRAITAIRDNRIAAESVGIGITRYKLTAFIISAFIAGMAGALYGMNFSTFNAKKFDFNTSILILVFVVLGGMGNIFGSIIATTVLYMLPELLREFSDYRMLIYAILLILVMLATNSERAILWRMQITNRLKRFFKLKTEPQEGNQNG